MTDKDPPTSAPALEEREDDGAPGRMHVLSLHLSCGVCSHGGTRCACGCACFCSHTNCSAKEPEQLARLFTRRESSRALTTSVFLTVNLLAMLLHAWIHSDSHGHPLCTMAMSHRLVLVESLKLHVCFWGDPQHHICDSHWQAHCIHVSLSLTQGAPHSGLLGSIELFMATRCAKWPWHMACSGLFASGRDTLNPTAFTSLFSLSLAQYTSWFSCGALGDSGHLIVLSSFL